jgi:hypothetical protein
MITEQSKALLQKMCLLEEQVFIYGRGDLGTMNKQSAIKHNFLEIEIYVETHLNSRYKIQTIGNNGKCTMAILIDNIEDDQNDHTKDYILTVSPSSETFKVERIIYHERPKLILEKDYNPKKI